MEPLAITQRKEKISQLSQEKYDLLVIGAGITGASIAWDAALRGLKVAIIDKEDFASGTSSGSSKLVHAGIRYLASGEFNLVRHASRERQWMFKACPHQTTPMPFIIPIYKKGKNTFLKLAFAGILYDILANFRNTKNHTFLNKKQTLKVIPNIKRDKLLRSLYYWDGIMDDARVTLETILSAQEKGAVTINYVKCLSFNIRNDPKFGEIVEGILAEDKLTNKKFTIRAKCFVNATGPWFDEILAPLSENKKYLRLTKGIHIITKRLIKEDIILIITADDSRGLFVIPFRKKYSLIGTTDTDYKGNIEHVNVTREEVDYIISATNNDLPKSISYKDVISAYSGLRPMLIPQKAKSESATSREFEIFTTKRNLLSIAGGKYTIFRYMAEKTVNKVINVLQLKKRNYKCKTTKTFLHGGEEITDFGEYLQIHVPAVMKKYQLPIDIANHLVQTYGTAYPELISIIKEDESLKKRIGEGRPYIEAEIVHAVKKEMCCTLSDFMLRRTQLQLIDNQGLDCINDIAEKIGKLLGWSVQEKQIQIENYKKDLVWTSVADQN